MAEMKELIAQAASLRKTLSEIDKLTGKSSEAQRKRDADPAERLRFCFVDKPRCPRCGSARLKTLRSMPAEDESRTQRKLCEDCGWRFFVVWS